MDILRENMMRQLKNCTCPFMRYIYPSIKWENHMLGLVGPRGCGKTTLFLQRIKQACNLESSLYVSADHMYFSTRSLYDVAENLFKNNGTHLFIDEVHKYPNWSSELKAMYDSFPSMHIYFTGSSVLEIEKGNADLSRRAPVYSMQGLSFREFLQIFHGITTQTFTLEEIVNNKAKIPGIKHPLTLFKEYLKSGYYPFGNDPDYMLELEQVINRTLEIDIPQYADMTIATGRKLKNLMWNISQLVPFKPNMSSLGRTIKASRNNMESYLAYMEKAGMIIQLRDSAKGLGALGKTEKIYLENTNLMHALVDKEPNIGTIRENFFINQMRVNNIVQSSKVADFKIGKYSFEIGGKSKGQKQLKDVENGIVVKDNIEYAHGNVVPLWAFGLNY